MLIMKKIIFGLLFLCFTGFAFAQSADVVTEIMDAKEVTFGQVCYLSAVHQGLVDSDASFEDAIQALYDKKQLPGIVNEFAVVPMANLAFIYAQMWNIKGGLMYKITKGSPRYAFKQLKVDGILPSNADPAQIVTGVQALNLYTSCSLLYGKETLEIEDEPKPAPEAEVSELAADEVEEVGETE